MSKAGAILTLSGSACLAVALALSWDGLQEQPPFAAQPQTAKRPPVAGNSLGMAPEGWQTFTRQPSPVAAAPSAESMPAPVVVTFAHRNNDTAAKVPILVQAPHDRVTLVRELQRGLKRAGCYEGEINGVWTPQSRNAMKLFTGRLNAALPVDEPDEVLLALVQGQDQPACGIPCPPGQALAADGRCLPSALLARAKKLTPSSTATAAAERVLPSTTVTGWSSTTAGWASTTVATTVAPPPIAALAPEERMGLAGPAAEPTPAKASTGLRFPSAPALVQKRDLGRPARFGAGLFRKLDRMGTN